MGYFDALTSSYFKTAQDGRKLFFPWGVLGRGYIVDSEQAYERLRRQIKVFTLIGLVLIFGASALARYVAALVIAAVFIVFYVVWSPFLLRGLQQSNEKLSLEESMTSQGGRLLGIIALAFVVLGIVILVRLLRSMTA